MDWLNELHGRLDQSRTDLLDAVASVRDWDQRPDSGGWSPREILEHVAIVEQLFAADVVALTEKGLNDPDCRAPADKERRWEVTGIRRAQDQKFMAPDSYLPMGGRSVDDLLASLTRSRAQIAESLGRLAPLETDRLRARHPFGFELNVLQWIDNAAWHEARHVDQLRTAAGLPR